MFRSRSSGSPSLSSSQVAKSVKTTKLETSPAMIRHGFRPEAPEAPEAGPEPQETAA